MTQDTTTFQEVDRLGRNLLEGLIVLNDLFQRGIAVKVPTGIAAGEHTERHVSPLAMDQGRLSPLPVVLVSLTTTVRLVTRTLAT
ncbi:hypothetical protein [Nonomuraea sp. NPDC052265]|uniref:hypothetical protein n=1 Tax=Nonomuraea sp. NPDC052265 TaxID=3364374 RepID=UPI0037CA5AC0